MQLVRNIEQTAEIDNLREMLNTVRLQDLREIARHWNWPLRGNVKADIVEQMIGYYRDPARQKTLLASLSPLQMEAMRWLDIMINSDPQRTLPPVLKLTSGQELTAQNIADLLQELTTAGLIFTPEDELAEVPVVIINLLPPLHMPRLLHRGPLEPAELISPPMVEEEISNLIARTEADRPVAIEDADKGLSLLRGSAYQPQGAVIGARPGLLNGNILANWGYRGEREQDRARFYLALMLYGRLLQVDKQGRRLTLQPRSFQAWQEQPPENHLAHLFNWWMQAGPDSNDPTQARAWLTFHEFDLTLRQVSGYQLRWSGGWTGANDIQENDLLSTRRWLTALLANVQPDTWYHVEDFCRLIYHIRRDLLRWNPYLAAMIWHKDKQRLEVTKMDFVTWNATYGAFLRAWLAGPASWLGLVQVGYGEGRTRGEIVAFRRPGPKQTQEPVETPADTLRYLPDGTLALRNIWQAGVIRPYIARLAVELARQREVTLYKPDAGAFRKTLTEGGSAEQVIQSFTSMGFPLPRSIAAQLRAWQERAGRHRLYDDVAVIEFADDMALREVLAATGAEASGAYILSPRCLVLPNPDAVPDLLDELNRKGYNPRVLRSDKSGSNQP